jgi:hypothetical protein
MWRGGLWASLSVPGPFVCRYLTSWTRLRLYMPSSPGEFRPELPPPPLRLFPGGAIQFPGGFVSRCGPAPFHGALLRQLTALSVTEGEGGEVSKIFWLKMGSIIVVVSIGFQA